MGMPAAAATLNRFPGLQLKAWALCVGSGSGLIASFNMTSCTLAGMSLNFVMTNTIGSTNYVLDVASPSFSSSNTLTSGTAFSVAPANGSGTPINIGGPLFVAVYAP